jgi:hypothetical protein
MGNRLFYENVTVWSWNGETSLKDLLGDGTMTTEITLTENAALNDFWSASRPTGGKRTVTFELAAEASDYDFETEVEAYAAGSATAKNFVFTRSDGESRTSACWITNVTKKIGSALRQSVTLQMTGDPVA